jgi:hypothetical protein
LNSLTCNARNRLTSVRNDCFALSFCKPYSFNTRHLPSYFALCRRRCLTMSKSTLKSTKHKQQANHLPCRLDDSMQCGEFAAFVVVVQRSIHSFGAVHCQHAIDAQLWISMHQLWIVRCSLNLIGSRETCKNVHSKHKNQNTNSLHHHRHIEHGTIDGRIGLLQIALRTAQRRFVLSDDVSRRRFVFGIFELARCRLWRFSTRVARSQVAVELASGVDGHSAIFAMPFTNAMDDCARLVVLLHRLRRRFECDCRRIVDRRRSNRRNDFCCSSIRDL